MLSGLSETYYTPTFSDHFEQRTSTRMWDNKGKSAEGGHRSAPFQRHLPEPPEFDSEILAALLALGNDENNVEDDAGSADLSTDCAIGDDNEDTSQEEEDENDALSDLLAKFSRKTETTDKSSADWATGEADTGKINGDDSQIGGDDAAFAATLRECDELVAAASQATEELYVAQLGSAAPAEGTGRFDKSGLNTSHADASVIKLSEEWKKLQSEATEAEATREAARQQATVEAELAAVAIEADKQRQDEIYKCELAAREEAVAAERSVIAADRARADAALDAEKRRLEVLQEAEQMAIRAAAERLAGALTKAAVTIQATTRGWLTRRKFRTVLEQHRRAIADKREGDRRRAEERRAAEVAAAERRKAKVAADMAAATARREAEEAAAAEEQRLAAEAAAAEEHRLATERAAAEQRAVEAAMRAEAERIAAEEAAAAAEREAEKARVEAERIAEAAAEEAGRKARAEKAAADAAAAKAAAEAEERRTIEAAREAMAREAEERRAELLAEREEMVRQQREREREAQEEEARQAEAAVREMSAEIIQEAWRAYAARQANKRAIEFVDLVLDPAATIIQSCWRGWRLRKRLAQVRAEAVFDDEDDFDYAEVDLAELELDEDALDAGFSGPEIADLPAGNAAPLKMRITVPQARHAWEASPERETPQPVTRRSSDKRPEEGPQKVVPVESPKRSPDRDASRAAAIGKEWGFSDPKTAAAMVKRAKRLGRKHPTKASSSVAGVSASVRSRYLETEPQGEIITPVARDGDVFEERWATIMPRALLTPSSPSRPARLPELPKTPDTLKRSRATLQTQLPAVEAPIRHRFTLLPGISSPSPFGSK